MTAPRRNRLARGFLVGNYLLDGCNQSCGDSTFLTNYFAGQLEQNLIDALTLKPDLHQVRAKCFLLLI